MINLIKRHKWTIVMFAIMGLVLALPSIAGAQMFEAGRDLPGALQKQGAGMSLREIVKRAIDFVLGFVGLIAIIMLIYGGFLYMTSGGGEGKDKGKQTIIYAIVGIVIILFSFAIVNTVFTVTQGTDTGSGGV